MRKHVKLGVLGAIAILAMALSASSASAIIARPAGNITARSLGRLTFSISRESAISCPVTLTGTIATSINASANSEVGEINGGSVGTCDNGTASVLVGASNPWAITFQSTELTSTPRTAELSLTRSQFLIAAFGLTCLYMDIVPLTLEGEGSPVVTRLMRVKANASVRKNLQAGLNSDLCPASGELRGTFEFTRQTLTLP